MTKPNPKPKAKVEEVTPEPGTPEFIAWDAAERARKRAERTNPED